MAEKLHSEIEEIALTQLIRFDPRGEELIYGKIGEARYSGQQRIITGLQSGVTLLVAGGTNEETRSCSRSFARTRTGVACTHQEQHHNGRQS